MAATLLTDTELERDRRLVESHQAGDASAFGELYQLHYARLVRFCQRKVRDGHLAEEIAQETFLKAYRSMPTLEGGRRFYPWLTVIASRLVIDHHRRAGRVMPAAEVDPGTVDDVQDDLERQVERDQVLQALDRVRGRHREVLRLRDYEEMSYEAIAQRLGTSPTVVQSLLHRARQALRREYLLVTEHSVLTPVLAPVAVLLRRARLRAGRLTAWVPDAGILGAPLAAAAIIVTGAFGAVTPDAARPAQTGTAISQPRAGEAAAPHAPPAALVPQGDLDAGGRGAGAPRPDADAPVEMWLGPAGAQEARTHGEQMPAQVDTAVGMIALDPPVIIQDTVDAAAGLLGEM